MTLRNEDAKGWVGSILFHLVVAILLFFWQVDVSVSEPEFLEVSWGTITQVPAATAVRPSMPGTEGHTQPKREPTPRSMNLPERTFNTPDEVVHIPTGKKMDVDERSTQPRVQVAENATGRKERGTGIGLGEKEQFTTPGFGESAGEIANPNVTGTAGSDVGSSVSMSMQWAGGGSRKKISGDLPEYPAGVNVEAQIKIESVVLPDGSVKSLKPAQKGNTKLEEAAMRAVRLWKFEPLAASTRQADQTCIITFNFHLR